VRVYVSQLLAPPSENDLLVAKDKKNKRDYNIMLFWGLMFILITSVLYVLFTSLKKKADYVTGVPPK
jgi:hypothetical protein